MFSGFDVSKYANPVFGPHLFFVSRAVDQKTCSDRLQELCHELTVARGSSYQKRFGSKSVFLQGAILTRSIHNKTQLLKPDPPV